jgi:phenylglyoxylate dehydrogenase epsilon subunit
LARRRQIIVGSGTAAVNALKQIRKAGCDDEVLVLTMERHAPYSPMSLPYVILGRKNQSDIQMVADDFFDRMGAVFVKDRKVVAVEPAEQRLSYEGGGSDRYDRLLIATGSDPIVPPALKEVGAMGFHVMDDCIALTGQLTGTKRVAIVGAGPVAMELAAALATKGHRVTVVAPRERILRNYFDIEASTRIIDLFTASGVVVNLKWGEAVKAERRGNEVVARFAEGCEVETDILLACLGVKARVSFLRGSGIGVNEGVVVDRHMRTNLPHIFAAGDVAEACDFFSGRNRVNPILPNAASQGKVAGDNMADRASEYEGSFAMNAFNFFEHLALSIGKVVADEGDEVLEARRNGSHIRLVFTGDRLTGASFLDTDVEAGVIQYLIRKRIRIGKYREMLLQAPREMGFWLMNEAEKGEAVSKEE